MPRKKTVKTKPTKKATTPRTRKEVTIMEAKSATSLFDYLRFGESYTSLLLGIVVVIISTLLLLSFVHNRNAIKTAGPKDTSSAQTNMLTGIPSPSNLAKAIGVSEAPTQFVKQQVKPKTSPTKAPVVTGNSYIVTADDTLWKIAEKKYKSGYNWVDIAQANKLANPSVIHKGDKLILPNMKPKLATASNNSIQQGQTQAMIANDKITGTTYTINKGDTLWSIAVRAYGDGYKWVAIAKANNLTNPGLIHSKNVLKIPRG